MEERVLKQTAAGSVMFSVGVLLFLLLITVSNEKIPVIDTTIISEVVVTENVDEKFEALKDNTDLAGFLKIPLPQSVQPSDISIDNQYLSRILQISINGITLSDIDKKDFSGNQGTVQQLLINSDSGNIQLSLQMNSVYEPDWYIDDHNLYVSWMDPNKIYDKIVVIDAGHGSKAAGTVEFGILEKDINLAMVLELKELLDNSGIKAYYTRLDDSNPSFDDRVNLANDVKADFFLSIHNNADKHSSSYGTEVLYSESQVFQNGQVNSEWFANLCQEELTKSLDSRNRGLVKGDGIYIIRNSQVPVALVEVGFITNYSEAQKLKTTEYQKKAAEGIYSAIVRAFQEEN